MKGKNKKNTKMTKRKRGKQKYRSPMVNFDNLRLTGRLGGFPDSVTVKLRYVEFINLNPELGGLDQHVFRANSGHDPNYTETLTGHQPYYYDQWSRLYTHYTVLGSKCRMEYLPGAASQSNQQPGVWGILLDTSTTGIDIFSSTNNILESSNSTDLRIAGFVSSASNPPNRNASCSLNYSTRKFFGIEDPNDGNSYSASTSSSPNQEAYFCCWFGDIEGNDPSEQQFAVTIDYIIQFRDRRTVNGS